MIKYQDLIDQKVNEAQKNGEFDNLPGAGKPLDLTALLPAGLQMYATALKNADITPGELEKLAELNEKKKLLADTSEETQRKKLLAEIAKLEPEVQLQLERFAKMMKGE